MSILNQITCVAAGGNTGIDDCSLTLQNVLRGFLVPSTFELTDSQLATADTALAALIAATINDNPLLRVYPLPEVVGVTDSSEDVVLQTLGYGTPVPVRAGNYNLTFQYVKGGNCVNIALQKFNNGNYRYIGIEAQGILFGAKTLTGLKGIPLDYFYADKFKFADGSNIATFAYRVSFKPEYINASLGFIQLDLLSVMDIAGLKNAKLSSAAARAAGVMKIRVNTGCSSTDLYPLYTTELANAALWRVTRNGAAVTITSVAADANLKAFTITLDTTDPDYNSAGPFVVNLAPPSVLTAAGVLGVEGLAVTVA